MSEMDIRQYKTSVEEFLGLKELHPQGRYTVCSGGTPNRTTWFSFTIPINNIDVEFTWHLTWEIDAEVWTKTCEELELI
tara:strand:- start:601 stop:837 length:237 start_codon:yes stop_codon:yes gene_type:complete